MEFRTCIKIRKKGFNYYTDYIDKFFDDVFSKHGYHLVKNPVHSEYSLFLIIDDSPWMSLVSTRLDELEMTCIEKLVEDISQTFKAEVIIESYITIDTQTAYEFHFSTQHNAFEEPAFIQEGETKLEWHTTAVNCTSGNQLIMSCLNYGGISRGLEVRISGDFVEKDTATFTQVQIHSYDQSRKNRNRLVFEATQQKIIQDGISVYLYDFADFVIPEGVNRYSAKLRGKKGQDERNARTLYLSVIVQGDQTKLDTMNITISPKSNRAGGVQWPIVRI